MGSSDYEVELRGGPLAGRTARVRDTEVRLSVVRERGELRVDTMDDDGARAASRARVIGCYRFSHRVESLVWFPARE
jgi:hypothetical protein